MRISGATVFDPANGVEGEKRDIYISGNEIVDNDPNMGTEINGEGLIAMAGGIDIHTHVLGLSRLARLTGNPSLKKFSDANILAEKFLKQGITFFVEAGLMLGDLENLPEVEMEHAILNLAGGKADKRFLARKYIGKQGLEEFFNAKETDGPTPHIHLPNLASGSGVETLKKFLEKLGDRKCHLSHVSHYAFSSKGGKLIPAAEEAAELLSEHTNVTFDLAPIGFGPTTTFTAERELAERISSAGGGETISHANSPYRAVGYRYKKESYINSVIWIVGMELLLHTKERAALSIDFPSGGSLETYPHIIACLMDAQVRNAFLETLNADAVKVSSLGKMEREYSFQEIAQITRANPADFCNFKKRGHMGTGAVADIALYEVMDNREKMFSNPAHVIQNGKLIA